jgi:formylglycine-generating enzyme required for sulfatase activity
VDKATEDVALWQELDTLRKALREKDRLVDVTAAQCRRLEDELEDHHQAYDGLKQNLERNKLLLAETRELAASLSKERQQMEERIAAVAAAPGGIAAPARRRPPVRRPVLVDRRFLVGAALGGLLAAAAAVGGLLWLRPDSIFGSTPRAGSDGGAAALSPGADQRQLDADSTIEQGSGVGAARTLLRNDVLPVEARTERDRLRDGTPGPLMLLMSEGAFAMGRPRTLPTDDEGPAHEVRVGAFLIGATEVTFDEYDRFARATGKRLPKDFGWGRGRRPVVGVSWSDAKAYTRWLSQQTGQHYRLPSEAEWEYAARAGQPSSFWWGYRKGHGRAVCFDCGSPWDNRFTVPVASFPPNPFGLYDTASNVMEWVEDCYHPSYADAPTDGRPWVDTKCTTRVARGGAFNKPAQSMRTVARHQFAPETRINVLGFRIARDE